MKKVTISFVMFAINSVIAIYLILKYGFVINDPATYIGLSSLFFAFWIDDRTKDKDE